MGWFSGDCLGRPAAAQILPVSAKIMQFLLAMYYTGLACHSECVFTGAGIRV
jgi:hypothetical protein